MSLTSEEKIRKFDFSAEEEGDLVDDPDDDDESEEEGEEQLNPQFQFALQSDEEEDEAISPWNMQDALGSVLSPTDNANNITKIKIK